MGSWTTFILWVIGLVYFGSCLWLILVVLLQEGKAGGFGAGDGGSAVPSALSDSLGAGGAQRGLFRMTAITATVFMVLAIALTRISNHRDSEGGAIQLPSASETAPPTQVDTSSTPAGTEATTPAETATATPAAPPTPVPE